MSLFARIKNLWNEGKDTSIRFTMNGTELNLDTNEANTVISNAKKDLKHTQDEIDNNLRTLAKTLNDNTRDFEELTRTLSTMVDNLDSDKFKVEISEDINSETNYNMILSSEGIVLKISSLTYHEILALNNENWIGKDIRSVTNYLGNDLFKEFTKGLTDSIIQYTIKRENGSYKKVNIHYRLINGLYHIIFIPLMENNVRFIRNSHLENIMNDYDRSHHAIFSIRDEKIVGMNTTFRDLLCKGRDVSGKHILEILHRNNYKTIKQAFFDRKLLTPITIEVSGVNYTIILDDYVVDNQYTQEICILIQKESL